MVHCQEPILCLNGDTFLLSQVQDIQPPYLLGAFRRRQGNNRWICFPMVVDEYENSQGAQSGEVSYSADSATGTYQALLNTLKAQHTTKWNYRQYFINALAVVEPDVNRIPQP